MKEFLNVTVFKCEFCNKKLFRKHAMVNHEKWCNSNPANDKACRMCKFLEETKVDYEVDTEYGAVLKTAKGFVCTKKDKMVYPLIVEKKGLVNAYPETFEDQIPMPRECNDFEGVWTC